MASLGRVQLTSILRSPAAALKRSMTGAEASKGRTNERVLVFPARSLHAASSRAALPSGPL